MAHVIFYMHQTNDACGGVCVHAIAHIKLRRLVHHSKFLYLLKFSSETHAILL